MPFRHIRSVEELTVTDLPLYQKMLETRETLLAKHFPEITSENRNQRVRSGFHRGSRNIFLILGFSVHVSDIISVKHLHLHVIIDVDNIGFFKFPVWNEFVFVQSDTVLRRLEREEKEKNRKEREEYEDRSKLEL